MLPVEAVRNELVLGVDVVDDGVRVQAVAGREDYYLGDLAQLF